MSVVMSGLAKYEIIKTGIGIFILVILLCCAIYMIYYSMKKNYKSANKCNIYSNRNDNQYTQTLTYVVQGETYTKDIPAQIVKNNNISTKQYTYPEGICKLYYASANPNDYSVNYKPTTVYIIMSVVLFFIALLMIGWFIYLRANRDVAGVMGGIDAAQTVVSAFNNN